MYSTKDDIPISAQSLIDLTDDANAGTLNLTVLNGQIQRADRLIDAYLRGQYVVPFDPVPPEVTELSAQITWYYLEQRRSNTPSDGARDAYKDSLALLKDLQAGRATLSTEGQESDIRQAPGRIVSNKTASDQLFTKSLLDRF